MSYAEENLNFMFWVEATSISPKQQKRRKQRVKKAKENLAEPVGKRLRCACCGKRFIKRQVDQVVCSKNWCNNKLLEINYKE